MTAELVVGLVELLDLVLRTLALVDERPLLAGELAELGQQRPAAVQQRLEPSFERTQPLAVVALLPVRLLGEGDPRGHVPRSRLTSQKGFVDDGRVDLHDRAGPVRPDRSLRASPGRAGR